MCIDEWDCILARLFGNGDVGFDSADSISYHFNNFGRYIMRRQQFIYKVYRIHRHDVRLKLQSIYKDRVGRYYEHAFYDAKVEETM